MKKLFLLVAIMILSGTFALASANSDDIKFCKNYMAQLKKERAAVSNALQLSDEQSKSRYELTKRTNSQLSEKFEELNQETLKLNILKSDSNDDKCIKKQEQTVSKLKKEINSIVDKENKEFKKILNHEQRSKLRLIQKLQRKAAKSSKHPKDYYKSNPKMRKFAPHIQAN